MKTIKIIGYFVNPECQYCKVQKDSEGKIYLTYFKADKITPVDGYEGNEMVIDGWIEQVKRWILSQSKLYHPRIYKLWSY